MHELSFHDKVQACQLLTVNAAQQLFKLSLDIHDQKQRETTRGACKLAHQSLGELLEDLAPSKRRGRR